MTTSTFCHSRTVDVPDICGSAGRCSNETTGIWRCICEYPSVNVGDLSADVTLPCMYQLAGIQAVWALCGIAWCIVFFGAFIVSFRLCSFVPQSAKRDAEIILLSCKTIHSALFVTLACLEIFGENRRVGLDLAATLVYCFASSLFWLEYKLFLVLPTLSSVTAIARVIAPRPMQIYTMAAPFLIAYGVAASFVVLGMVLHDGQDLPKKTFAIIHIELIALLGALFMGSQCLAMTAILRKFREILNTTNSPAENPIDEAGANTSGQVSKIVGVEEQVQQLRKETLILLCILPISLIVFGAVEQVRLYSTYVLGVFWAIGAFVTLRFIFLSNGTVAIHLRRGKTDLATDRVMAHYSAGGDLKTTSKGNVGNADMSSNDITAFQSGSANQTESSARSAISKIARRRKKRRPKYINAMTRVEEERTTAMSRAEKESYTFINSNDMSKSQQPNSA